MRVIRKYPNRRLYDTETGRFVNLGELQLAALHHPKSHDESYEPILLNQSLNAIRYLLFPNASEDFVHFR